MLSRTYVAAPILNQRGLDVSNCKDFRVLLLGANGLLGTELTSALAPIGTLMRCTRATCHSNPKSMLVDVLDADTLRRVIRDSNADLIINAAAYTSVDAAEVSRVEAHEINGVVPGIIGEEAARSGATVFHFSSDYIFSGSGGEPWREDDTPSPINVYGHSKLAGERSLIGSGARHLIIRTAWLYGLGRQGFVNRVIKSVLEGGEMQVVADAWGTPTSARFVASTVARLSQNVRQNDYPLADSGILHVVCSGCTTWFGFAREICEQLCTMGCVNNRPIVQPISSDSYASPAKRPKNSVLSTERLEALGVVEIPSWQEELSSVLRSMFDATTRKTACEASGGHSCNV